MDVVGNDGEIYITTTGPGTKMDVDKVSVTATGGDAKGQPVQINHPSHGSPWVRIRRIMVGAAYS